MSDGPLVLVADDNEVNRLSVRAALADTSYRIIDATDGREVVDRALEHRPDLILMDLMMPTVDGLEATRELKAHDENNECGEGDLVTIAECRPISKHKAWRLVEIVERATVV